METSQQSKKPWALLFILIGIVLFIMAWTSFTFILRIIVALSALFLVDTGVGMLGLPTLSQLISSLLSNIKKQ